MKKISVLIPCFNEELTLPLLYPELVGLMDSLPDYEWELMFVNDGSIDGTLDVLKKLRRQAQARVAVVLQDIAEFFSL